MKWRVFALKLCLCGSRISKAQGQLNQTPDTLRRQPGIIVGTVVNVNYRAHTKPETNFLIAVLTFAGFQAAGDSGL